MGKLTSYPSAGPHDAVAAVSDWRLAANGVSRFSGQRRLGQWFEGDLIVPSRLVSCAQRGQVRFLHRG